ncbi:MAG: class II fructose-bisphosphate aldolase [Patescibacteria group bacterium]
MKYARLEEILKNASREHYAIGHFNISTLELLQGVVEAVGKTKTPVMIGLSEGERKHIGLERAACLVKTYESELSVPLFLNADHSKSVESACAAADAGFDSIHIDASEHPYEKNVEMTRAVALYVQAISPDISVEGELGFVPGESKIGDHEIKINESLYTNPDAVADFIEKTGINRLAIFVGNVHGLNKNEPNLDIERIRQIRKNAPESVALVLHAGSGIPREDIDRAIIAGIANVHISTELRLAFFDGVRHALVENPKETTPYKFFQNSVHCVSDIVEEKIIAFRRGYEVKF